MHESSHFSEVNLIFIFINKFKTVFSYLLFTSAMSGDHLPNGCHDIQLKKYTSICKAIHVSIVFKR